MKKCLAMIAASLISVNAMSAPEGKFICLGMDSNNNQKLWQFVWDTKSDKFLINGSVFKIHSSRKVEKYNAFVMYTENFEDTDGRMVYNAIARYKNDDKYYLIQFDAKTHKFIASIQLSCRLE